jgi:hypothetical protein
MIASVLSQCERYDTHYKHKTSQENLTRSSLPSLLLTRDETRHDAKAPIATEIKIIHQ